MSEIDSENVMHHPLFRMIMRSVTIIPPTNIEQISFDQQIKKITPCTDKFIEELEIMNIIQEDIDDTLSCAICQEEFKLDELKVPGCQSNLWLMVERKGDTIHYRAVSDAVIVKGLVALMLQILDGRTQKEIQNFDIDLLKELGIKGILTPGRQNGVRSLIQRIQLLAA